MDSRIQDWVFKRWILVAYLIVLRQLKPWQDQIAVEPNDRFYATVAKYINEYLVDNKLPPEDIQVPIMNLAEDFVAGRAITMRGGDYICLMNHVRQLGAAH